MGIPCCPGLAFGQETFNTLTFLVGPTLGGGGTTLDEEARPAPAFTFLATGFSTTSAFRFLLADCEATELG
jgi:hypothetical protein